MTFNFRLVVVLAALTAAAPAPALGLDCGKEAGEELRRLAISDDQAADVRYVQKLNPTDHGPAVLGVRAWIRLKSCDSGYLVIDMTRSCFVRQSYTRGDCRLSGVTAY